MKENREKEGLLVKDADGVEYGIRTLCGGCEITEIRYPITDGPETLTVPAALAGQPVLAIGERAFANEGGVLGPQRIVLPDSVRSIGDHAFAQGSMTEIRLPRGLVHIGEGAFEDCRELAEISLPRTVTEIGDCAFAACASLRAIDVEEGSTAFSSIGGNLYTRDGSALLHYAAKCPQTSLVIPEGTARLPAFAFYECENLREVTLPHGITEIPLYAFCGCRALVSVTLPEGVGRIGASAFEGCLALRSVALPSTLGEIGRAAFWGCRSLCELALPAQLTAIGRAAFRFCTSLTTLALPEGIERIGADAFWGCGALASVKLPLAVAEIGEDAFAYCAELTVSAAAPARPNGWSPDWNPEDRPVVWGYTE